MSTKNPSLAIAVLTACILTWVSTCAAGDGDKVSDEGVITARAGNTLTIKTSDGPVTVTVSGDTKVQQHVGLGIRKKQMPADVLVPGLKLSFEGVRGEGNQIEASSLTFDSDDLALAEVIQAGVAPTAHQAAANQAAIAAAKEEIVTNRQRIDANKANIDEVAQSTQKRFSEFGEFVEKGEYTVRFATGDYSLSEADKQALAELAKQASYYQKGYLIQVTGFADSVGAATSNQDLSKERAEAVVAYLLQDCGIPVGRIVAPGALGETNPTASNESVSGRAENRRAEVKLLINKGIAAGNR